MTENSLAVRDLAVAYRQGPRWIRVVDEVTFTVAKGEVFGLVGESGSGKSTVALQLMGFRHPSLRTEGGAVVFKGHDLVSLPRHELDELRGNRISYVPQNPTSALDPGMRIASQIAEVFTAHPAALGSHRPAERVTRLLSLVGLPGASEFQRRYPHQLSGGQQQRVCIAMALASDPELVVLDEPTTGLDVTTQEQIISLLIELRGRLGMSMLYVTHDLGLLAQIADRVAVMYAGRIVEVAPTWELFTAPRHPYTRGLIGSIPKIDDGAGVPPRPMRGLLQRDRLPPGCPFAPRCDFSLKPCLENRQVPEPAGENRTVACWRWRDIGEPDPVSRRPAPLESRGTHQLLHLDRVSVRYGKGRAAVRDVSFAIDEGETFALVGESGSGKSTIARAISGLVPPSEGRIYLRSEPLSGPLRQRTKEQRRAIQFVFQNPDASLNPRARIGTIVGRPLEFFFRSSPAEVRAGVEQALDDVRLDGRYARSFGDQLSGGERQRVAIARALVAKPLLLLCDEILSALDVSVQASILALLHRLKVEHGIALLMISHDLAVVRMLADRVCVLFHGEIMEIGTAEAVFRPPYHPYTQSLLQSVPSLRKRSRKAPARAAAAGGIHAGSAGCAYAGRCPWQLGKICETETPPWREGPGVLRIRCHLPAERLPTRMEELDP